MRFKSLYLFVDAQLLLGEFHRVATGNLRQGLAKHVGSLIDLATIAVGGKIILKAHRGRIVEVARHDRLLGQIGGKVVITYPKQRVFGSAIAEVVFTVHHRTECQDLGMESGCVLVVIGTLLNIIAFDLSRGNVAVVDMHTTVCTLIEDVVVVEKLQRLDTHTFVEALVARIDIVSVGGNTAMTRTCHDEFKI